MSSVMPGCGKIAMSGRLLPATRLRISLSKSGVGENLTLMPSLDRKSFIDALKSSDCWLLKPYMIPAVLPVAFPPPHAPPLERPPASRRAEAPARAACASRRFLMVMRWFLRSLYVDPACEVGHRKRLRSDTPTQRPRRKPLLGHGSVSSERPH